jgi:hypothetical protein
MSIRTRHKSTAYETRASFTTPEAFRTFAAQIAHSTELRRVDVLEMDCRVYLEGVEVPFSDVSISEVYQQLPMATVSLPPFPGLPEIGRNYYPKVHVFYKDVELERYLLSINKSYTDKDIYRLRFAGVIHRCSYSSMRSAGGDQKYISFQCTHKYYPLSEVRVTYAGRLPETQDQGGDEVSKNSMYGSRQAAFLAMAPVKGSADSGTIGVHEYSQIPTVDGRKAAIAKVDVSVLPPAIAASLHRAVGVPGYLVNFWNILKRDAFLFKPHTRTMTELYVPLIDEGLRYFERMSGHPVIESGLGEGLSIAESDVAKTYQGTESARVSSVVVPPIFRNAIGEAVSVDMAVNTLQSFMINAGEVSSMSDLFEGILGYMRYDKVTLASPVQSATKDRPGVDVLLKPVLPLYYSPTCNVILPSMYSGIQVEESYYDAPTRVFARELNSLVQNSPTVQAIYRAPHLYRKAVSDALAEGPTGRTGKLGDTLAFYEEAFGTHEEGRGVRGKRTELSQWIQFLNMGLKKRQDDDPNSSQTYSESMRIALDRDWFERHRPKRPDGPTDADTTGDHQALDKLNPWKEREVNALFDYQRNVMLALDYDYSLALVEARIGSVQGVFNPHIVVGYPCDIISKNFSDPSYHGFVTSVTTTLSSSGHAATSFSFASAFTYEELYHYTLPPTQPWLADTLGLIDNPSLVDDSTDFQNTKAHRAARDFYMGTLGVGYARPSALYDFTTGKGKLPEIDPSSGCVLKGGPWAEGVNTDIGLSPGTTGATAYSTEGSLAMTRREIETMADIEQDFPVTFVHLPRNTDHESTVTRRKSSLSTPSYRTVLEYFAKTKEVGKSVFLQYTDDVTDENQNK